MAMAAEGEGMEIVWKRKRSSDMAAMEEDVRRLSHAALQQESKMETGSSGTHDGEATTSTRGQAQQTQQQMMAEEAQVTVNCRMLEACSQLRQLLAPDYCRLAFCLPITCTTIWNVLEEDIDRFAQEALKPCTQNMEDVLHFLSRFFAQALLQKISKNLRLLDGSYLGLQYTLRLGLARLGETIVTDLVEAHVCEQGGPLNNFFGACEGQIPESSMDKIMMMMAEGMDGDMQLAGGNDGWQTPKKTFGTRSTGGGGGGGVGNNGVGDGKGGGDGAEAEPSQARGGGAGGDGGGSGDEDIDIRGILSGTMHRIYVWMSEFVTSPKGKPKWYQKRTEVISRRSLKFIQNGAPSIVYDPWVEVRSQPRAFLYHGTRTSSLASFKRYGIRPRMHRNEFSFLPAFYTSSFLRYAYEHPLHNHVSQGLDPVTVLVFEVDVGVLHGERVAPRMQTPFIVKWLPATTEEEQEEWATFTLNNLKQESEPHNYDIVIGPICLPNPTMDKVSRLRLMDNGVEIVQVAFCSKNAQKWLESSSTRMHCEKRIKK